MDSAVADNHLSCHEAAPNQEGDQKTLSPKQDHLSQRTGTWRTDAVHKAAQAMLAALKMELPSCRPEP